MKNSGKYPVKIRIIYLTKHCDYRINLDLTQQEFDEAQTQNPKKKYREIEAQLDAVKSKARTIIDNLGTGFTFAKFKSAFYGNAKEASNIFTFFEDYITGLKNDDQLKTADGYTTTMNSLLRYKFDKNIRGDIGFNDIDATFLKSYHKWLATPKTTKNKKGKITTKKGASETTVGIYMRYIRSIYNYAIDTGVIKKGPDYPFGKRKYIIPASKNTKKALTHEEVKSIYNYTANIPAEDKARDFWMLSYMCYGINFKDIALLRRSNIDHNMIRFLRSKTKKTSRSNQSVISCPVTAPIQTIITKWQSDKKSTNAYLFEILEEGDSLETQQRKIEQFIKTTNKYIKRICFDLKIDKVVTTYFSRHSVATIMKKAGISVEKISESLGHSDIKTTRSYLDSFDDDSKIEMALTLTNF